VSNPGSGIAPEHLARIFDRFYRVDDSRSGSQSSSGLGLAIVKSIVTLHGGSVRVESIPDGLTTFSLIFPRSLSDLASTNS
jgi:two-component system heavy metal sensor histidine kinase CusS